MRVGVVARGENRGLGIQSWETARALGARALVVEMGELARGFASDPGRFDDPTVVHYVDGALPEEQVRAWLETVDVVYAPETLYDWRLADWCREMRVPVVVHINPEFFHPDLAEAHPPTAWWAPTPWRLDHLAPGTQVVPMPVATDRFRGKTPAPPIDRLTVLHVAGHRAAGDRNGTLILLQALRLTRRPVIARILTQDPRLPKGRTPSHVELQTEMGGRTHWWELYDDADVLVMPRRYGGLCLPVQEAAGAGLGLVLSDVAPNAFWPSIRVRARARGELRCPTGPVPLMDTSPGALAEVIDRLGEDRELLAAQQHAALTWARVHSWAVQAPLWLERLQRLG